MGFTGFNNRVSKKDVLKYLENRNNANVDNSKSLPSYSDNDLKKSPLSNDVEPMGHVRLMIADHMKKSRDTSVHVYSTSEVDITDIVNFRNANKSTWQNIDSSICVSNSGLS